MTPIIRGANFLNGAKYSCKISVYVMKAWVLYERLMLHTVLDADCSLLTKIRQQHMLNEKTSLLQHIPLLIAYMQLKKI